MAFSMLIVNFLFQVVGSTSDVECLGFLSANLAALLIIYPALAYTIGKRASAILIKKSPSTNLDVHNICGHIGLFGCLLYFIVGVGIAVSSGVAIPIGIIALLVLYTLLAVLAARYGAFVVAVQSRELAWKRVK